MEPACAFECTAGCGPIHVRRRQPRPRRPLPGVHDMGRSEHPTLAKQQTGRRAVVGHQIDGAYALATKPAPDRVAEAIRPDPADERHLMTEPGEPDRDVRLGASNDAVERRRLGQRPGRRRDERDEALPEGDDLGHAADPGRTDPARAAATAATTREARSRTPAGDPSPSSQPPIPTATAPAAMNDGAVSTVTPPVGTIGMSGNGPRISRTKAGPATEAGKSLIAAAPARHAARASVGVAQPGSAGTSCAAAQATSSVSRWGLTRKVAPASVARWAASIERTVPAPMSRPRSAPIRATASIERRASASGSLRVSSKARTPPSASARAIPGAASAAM